MSSSVGVLAPPKLKRAVAVLCTTEIVSWGVMYYAFPVLATDLTRRTGWSQSAATAAFSASLVISAIAGIWVGRYIDRVGPRVIMTAGSCVATIAMVIVALAPTYWIFLLGWLMAGLGMSATLYAPAFAAATRWAGERRVAALTAITLIGGLASTVFAPLTAFLNGQVDWRHTYLILAVGMGIVTIPLHWFGLNAPWVSHIAKRLKTADKLDRQRITRGRPFILLTVCMSCVAFCGFATAINLVPLLVERGFSLDEAALALALSGVGQLIGRLGYAPMSRRTGTVLRSMVVFAAITLSTAALALVSGPTVLIFGFSIFLGMARGIYTLLSATAITDRWGPHGYGQLNGVMTAPMMISQAVAPGIGAALAVPLGSQHGAFWILAAVCAVGTVLVPWTLPTQD
ncbi:MAG: MFS transporter [Antricoccus sp.]